MIRKIQVGVSFYILFQFISFLKYILIKLTDISIFVLCVPDIPSAKQLYTNHFSKYFLKMGINVKGLKTLDIFLKRPLQFSPPCFNFDNQSLKFNFIGHISTHSNSQSDLFSFNLQFLWFDFDLLINPPFGFR